MRDPEVTSRIMSAVRGKDTKPELAVRKLLWSRGYRYRTHYTSAVGKPDLAFLRAEVAVFIDGDFWHGNAWRVRGYDSLEAMFPTRTEWWVKKIGTNMARDRKVTRDLQESGWTVLRFWTSEVRKNLEKVVDEIAHTVDARQPT